MQGTWGGDGDQVTCTGTELRRGRGISGEAFKELKLNLLGLGSHSQALTRT